ncbi:MAG: 50S ribosomal protein L10 [Candidatus Omnitrophica bacterium]|nr:50S ribosomal protein L10 [Candidatus Omnitrophota bacterium]
MPGLEKDLMLKELAGKLEGCPFIFFARFKGLSVNDFSQLRRALEKVSKSCVVMKKTLLRKILSTNGIEVKNGLFEGSLVLVAAEKDPQVVSKVLVGFAKDKEAFQLAGVALEGRLLGASYVKELSSLPSRIELIAKVVGGIKAPITGVVLTLRGLVSGLVNVLDQVSKKKQA